MISIETKKIQQTSFLINFAIYNEIKKSTLRIENLKTYFIYIKFHENFEHDRTFNTERFFGLFKCKNKQLNQIIRFFRQIFRKFLFNKSFSKRQNDHTINIKNVKSIKLNVYFLFHSKFEKQI